MVLLAQVSDFHIDGGDIRAARELLRAPVPVPVCPGNHDRRDGFRRVLPGDPDGGEGPVNQVHHLLDDDRLTTHFRVVG